jgi:hypothetical protein
MKPDVVHTYNPITGEAEAERWQIQGQLGLHSVTLSKTNQLTKNPHEFKTVEC